MAGQVPDKSVLTLKLLANPNGDVPVVRGPIAESGTIDRNGECVRIDFGYDVARVIQLRHPDADKNLCCLARRKRMTGTRYRCRSAFCDVRNHVRQYELAEVAG